MGGDYRVRVPLANNSTLCTTFYLSNFVNLKSWLLKLTVIYSKHNSEGKNLPKCLLFPNKGADIKGA